MHALIAHARALLQRAASLLSRIPPRVVPVLQRGIARLKPAVARARVLGTAAGVAVAAWIARFRAADRRGKVRMAGPFAAACAAVAVFLLAWPYVKPPEVSSVYPPDTATDVEQTVAVEVAFDRAVDRTSVEKSLRVGPATDGSFRWDSDRLVTFVPAKPLSRGTTYTIAFEHPIVSALRIPSLRLPSTTFSTIGLPRIVAKSPEMETPQSRTPITLVFSQPMQPLTAATASGQKTDVITISPPIPGEGRWLGTTAYQYIPSADYRQATTYSVTVNPDLTSADGYKLETQYAWSFSGIRPRVEKTGPSYGYYGDSGVRPDASVSAYFNLPVDPKLDPSQYFVVYDKNEKPVPGRIVRERNALHFWPSVPWTRGETYAGVIKNGLKSADGPNGMEDDYRWGFSTIPTFAVQDTYPNRTNGADNESDVQISFNTTIPQSSVREDLFTISPPLTRTQKTKAISCQSPCRSVVLGGSLKRDTTYTLTVKRDVTDIYGARLAGDYSVTFTTGPTKTSISFIPSTVQVVVVNQETPVTVITRTRNVPSVQFQLESMAESDFLAAERASYQVWQTFRPASGKPVKSWSENIRMEPGEYVNHTSTLTDAKGQRLAPGYYYLLASAAGGESDRLVLVVSKSAVTIKRGSDSILAWVTGQGNGQPVAGMKLKAVSSSGTMLDEGITNKDGVAILKVKKTSGYSGDSAVYVIGAKDGDVTVTGSGWSWGINRYDFGLPYYQSHEDTEYPIYTVTDRPLYRPGQEVKYKGIVRKDTDGAFENVTPDDGVTVTVTDARGKQFVTETRKLTSFGTFSGTFTVSPDASLGYYTITAVYKDNTHKYPVQFQVEEYKRPDYKVTVKPAKDDFVAGDALRFTINASYYFGAAVRKASAFYTVKSEDYYFRWDRNPQYEFGNPDSYWYRPWSSHDSSNDQSVTEATGTTDGNGNIDVSVPFDMSKKKQSQRLIVDAAVTDISNRTVGASEELFIHKAGLYVGVKPKSYVNSAGRESGVDVVTLDPRGNELAKRAVTVDVNRVTWVSSREQDAGDGIFYYRNTPVEALETTVSLTTDDHGYGSGTFTPKQGGTYKIVAKSTDDRGNQAVSSTYLWVSGNEFVSTRENHDRIQLITDKYSYQKGETATMFVSTPFASDSAKTLVTFERGGVLEYKLADITGAAPTVSFPVTDRMIPNVFVSAVLVRGSTDAAKPPEFKMGYTEVRVNDNARKLTVDIATDRDRYQPRDTVRTKIQVRDAAGNPRKAELSLALVDRSLLDLSASKFIDPFDFFYEPRALNVDTAQSLVYSLNRLNENVDSDSKGGDGSDQSSLSTKRKYFPETDYWNAHITTDGNGRASIDIPLADNLTTWKFTATANSDKDAFGMGTKEILATKDVLLRATTPRFLSVGDEASLGAVVVNKTTGDLKVTIGISARGVTVADPVPKTVTMKAGDQADVAWKTTAGDGTDAAVTVKATDASGKVLDEVEVTMPVVAYHAPETTSTAGEVSVQKTEKIALPGDIVPKRGSLDLSVSSSLLGSAMSALTYLIDYPYRCSEQTTSRFYPAIPLSQLMKSSGMKMFGGQTADTLSSTVTLGIQKLQNEQKRDGGWGWWVESRVSDPFLTTYAYQALKEAASSGYGVSPTTLSSAESYLINELGTGNGIALDIQAFIVSVLPKSNTAAVAGYVDSLYDNRIRLSTEGKAYLYRAMVTHRSDGKRTAKVRDELMGLSRKSATGVHWEAQKGTAYTIMGNDISTTATVFEALLSVDPSNVLLPDIARYFQANLKNDGWYSTRTTSVVLHALVTYAKARGDFGKSYDYAVSLNGAQWKSGKLGAKDIGAVSVFSKPMADFRAGTTTDLVMTKKGSGTLYYTANLRYYLPYSEIKPLERGMTLIRSYEYPDGTPVKNNTVKAGSLLQVRLILVLNDTRHKLIIEDPLPAGLEAFNESLNGSVSNPVPQKKKDTATMPLYYDRKEYRDDRVAFFAESLMPGVYETTYMANATTKGTYHRAPATAYEMYMPDISGHTDGGWFTVTD